MIRLGGWCWMCRFCGKLLMVYAGVPEELIHCLECANAVIDCGDFAVRVKDKRW